MNRYAIILAALFSGFVSYAQTNPTMFPGNKPDAVKVDAPDGNFTRGNGASVDTIDIQDARYLVILRDDGTWRYIRNLSKLANDTTFVKRWKTDVPNPYSDMQLSTVPFRNTIILQDSASVFTAPYVGKYSSRFGWRHGRCHQGVDLPLKTGEPVYAAFDGRVRVSMTYRGYGNLVIVRHANGLETFYGHLSERKVETGQWVHSGDVIGLGGSTGHSTGPHLHFETRYLGFAFDPEWLADYTTGKLRQNVFVLKRTYLDPSSRYVPTSDEEEYEINLADEEEQARIAAEKARKEAEANAIRWHTVKRGETLSSIAAKNGTNITALKKLNPKINPNKLAIGQKIRVK